MILRPEELLELLGIVDSLLGKTLTISESISRDRQHGHERAMLSTIPMTISSVHTTPDGTRLVLAGEQTSYMIALEVVARFQLARNGNLEIAEHYEEYTERLTTIQV